jgi:hypothetical protein
MSTVPKKKKLKKFVIKKKKSKVIKEKKTVKKRAKKKKTLIMNLPSSKQTNFIKLGPSNYESNELEYDYKSDDESIVESLDSQPNFDLINKLPQLFEITFIKEDDQLSLASDDESMDEPQQITKKESFDIDTDSLFKDKVNGKIIYFDYNKNIIYNADFIIIGTTTEDGEIELDDRFSKDYKDLLEM